MKLALKNFNGDVKGQYRIKTKTKVDKESSYEGENWYDVTFELETRNPFSDDWQFQDLASGFTFGYENALKLAAERAKEKWGINLLKEETSLKTAL